LSWEAFEPLARLSYNVYLVHMTIMFIFIGKQSFTVSISDLLAVSSDLFKIKNLL
jgi:peptidoglycan/LPS O-acetylase OafA/YrhL